MAIDDATVAEALTSYLAQQAQWVADMNAWATGAANGGDGAGNYPMQTGPGTSTPLPGLQKIIAEATGFFANLTNADHVYPDEFDANLAPGKTWASTYDAAPALNAMFASSLATGRTPALRSNAHYYVSQKLVVDPSRQGLIGNGAYLDFALRTTSDPTAEPELLSDPGFDTGTPWVTSANNTMAPTYSGSDLIFEPAAGTYQYLEVGQQITCAAGQLLVVTVTVDEIDTISYGANTYRSALLTLRANLGTTAAASIGGGGNQGTIGTIANTDAAYTAAKTAGAPAVYTFNVQAGGANPYLRIQSNAGVKIAGVSIKIVPDNTFMLVQVPATGNLRGHNYHEFCNFKIGASAGAGFGDALLFDTEVASFASRAMFRNIDVSDGIARGIVLGNRAYLNVFINPRVVASQACWDTIPGSADAGEDFAIFGGNSGGGARGVRNMGGFALRFYGHSIDFSTQWIVGGSVKMFGGWLENNPAPVAGFPFIDASVGDVYLYGTRVQGDGSTVPVLATPFNVGAGCTLSIDAEIPYNMQGTTGALCSGSGRFIWQGKGGANKVLSGVTKLDDNHNILGVGGRFDDPNILIPVWVAAAAGQQQIDRRTLAFPAAGSITGDVTQGSRIISNTTTVPTSAMVEGQITDAGVLSGTLIAGYQGAGQVFTCSTTLGSQTVSVSPAPTASNAYGKYVWGPGIPAGAKIIGYSNSASTITISEAASATASSVSVSTANVLILSQPWNGVTTAAKAIGYQINGAARAGMLLSTDYARSGTQSLKFYKAGVGSGAFACYLAIPVKPNRAFGGQLYYKIPPNSAFASGATTSVYFDGYFAQIVGADAVSAVPIIGATQQFITDQPQTGLDIVNGKDWTQVAFGTNRVDASSGHDGYAPEWATHFLLSINLASVPNGFVMYLDDVFGCLM